MRFINNGGSIQFRIGESYECYWTTIKKNEIIDLSAEQGHKLGLTELKTTEGQIGNQVVQTKQIEVPEKVERSEKAFISNMKEEDWPYEESKDDIFLKELQSINGIGKKTAEDIIGIFKTKSELFRHMDQDNELPLRNDIEDKLRGHYGK
jgi:hypothetical protein